MTTRDQAISKLVDLDVRKWGEGERAASERTRRQLSIGLALNSLAHYDPSHIDTALAAEAKSLLTDADRRELRKGRW